MAPFAEFQEALTWVIWACDVSSVSQWVARVESSCTSERRRWFEAEWSLRLPLTERSSIAKHCWQESIWTPHCCSVRTLCFLSRNCRGDHLSEKAGKPVSAGRDFDVRQENFGNFIKSRGSIGGGESVREIVASVDADCTGFYFFYHFEFSVNLIVWLLTLTLVLQAWHE